MMEKLSSIASWNAQNIHDLVEIAAQSMDKKMGDIAQPIRVAVAGKAVSPPIDITLELLGKDRTLQRIEKAIAFVEEKIAGGAIDDTGNIRYHGSFSWGHSSAGRALQWHCRGRRFDPGWLHHGIQPEKSVPIV